MGGTITELRFQKRNHDRVSVYLDGRFAFGLAAIVAAGLRTGQTLTDAEIAQLGGRDEVEKAYERALDFLSYRPRSEHEVRRRLRRRNLDEEVIEETIARLRKAGLVDDAAFARYWVENRMQFKPRGGRVLRHELRQRGVAPEIVDQAIEGLDEEAVARRVARAGAHRYRDLARRDFQRKLGAYLARRGFSYGVIKPLVEELSQDINSGQQSEVGPG
jgi:regulatory protein